MARKRRSWPIGAKTIRDKLECLLEDAGVTLCDDLWEQKGAYRGKRFDCACWGCGDIRYNGEWMGRLYSWDTMTDCVRYGIKITKPDRADYGEWEVHACEPATPTKGTE